MTNEAIRRKREAGQGWLPTLLGLLVLVVGGFALGLVVGVVSEEPELVVGHVAGRSSEIDWSAEGGALPQVASPGPEQPATPPPAAVVPVEAAAPERIAATAAPSRPAPSPAPALPPVAAAPPQRIDADADSRFSIQVGAFAAADAAEKVAGELRQDGYPVQIVPPASDDRWRVRVGPITGREQADRTALRLKVEEKLPTWVVRESGA